MKPSPKDRCARTAVRDFLVGLALFVAVFALAMLDSRASRSAPAVIFNPATFAQSETVSPVNISTRTDDQEMLRRNGDAYSLRFPLVVAPRHADKPHLQPVKRGEPAGVSGPQRKFRSLQKFAALEGRRYSGRLANEDLPFNHPADRLTGAGGAEHSIRKYFPSEDVASPRPKSSKLAMNYGNKGAKGQAIPGTLEARDRTWILTVMALIFAAMTTLTLGLWRHLRRSVAPRRTGRRV